MMKKILIPPFNASSPEIEAKVATVMKSAPVMHLTKDEVVQTLRLHQLKELLRDGDRTSRYTVTVYQDDRWLSGCSADDQFLALLLDADCRQTIVTTKRCMYCFGQTAAFWRKVKDRCAVITLASVTMGGQYGGSYLGKGWKIAPHIKTLLRWLEAEDASRQLAKVEDGGETAAREQGNNGGQEEPESEGENGGKDETREP